MMRRRCCLFVERRISEVVCPIGATQKMTKGNHYVAKNRLLNYFLQTVSPRWGLTKSLLTPAVRQETGSIYFLPEDQRRKERFICDAP